MVQIQVNGETTEVMPPLSISSLLQQLAVDANCVAVEHNGQIITLQEQAQAQVAEGDCIEIVRFVGGG